MKITNDVVVTLNFRLTNEQGEVMDQSTDEPLVYLHGHAGLLPGLENALEGQEVGASVKVVVPPEEGYGNYDPDLDLAVPLEEFPEDSHEELGPGVRFQAVHPNTGEPVMYTIHEVDGRVVKCSGNHELAGKTLNFDLEVIGVREATAEEINHGHVHH